MSGKGKNFPLSLSAVVEKAGGKVQAVPRPASGARIATPQTATKNAAGNAQPRVRQPDWLPQAKPAKPREIVERPDEREHPLGSEAVRRAMVQRIARQGVRDELVLAAMEAVPRHLFIEPALISQAYIDASIPIGHQQTISQPYIVARMIEVLRSGQNLQRVLEIGTGCGYQAAVLSCLASEVYSIERIKPLHELAKNNLRPLRIANIRLQHGDGMQGLPQVAPFDGIILAAAGLEVPSALLEQLAIGGRLVAPVGGRQQVLQLVQRTGKSEWTSQTLEDCHFVPLCSGVL